VFFGGVDLSNETLKALTAVAASRWRTVSLDVVVGAGNPHREAIADAVRQLPRATLHVQVPNLARLFAEADLAIGAGGTSTWERFCVGLPSLLVAAAANQVPTLEALASDGYVVYLGASDRVTVDDYRVAFGIVDDRLRLTELSRRCMALVDGRGADRVGDAMGVVDSTGPEPVIPG
jgi:spore coat polysaccharide biosynthesis predicted glycosyltransferase SpsG